MQETILFGTYTKKNSQGIYQAILDTEKKEITKPKLLVSVGNPTYLTMAPNNILLTIKSNGNLGGIGSYEFETLNLIDQKLEEKPNPCYISFDEERNFVYTANYHTAQIQVYNLNCDNTLSLKDTVTISGKGIRAEQESSHLHYINLTPDNKVVAIDLGGDSIYVYSVSLLGKLKEEFKFTLEPGFGPRHLVFAPNKKYAYVVGELSSQIATLKYDDGKFELIEVLKTIPKDFMKHNGSSAIRISNDGNFIYVANRGHNSLAIYHVKDDGKLTLLDFTDVKGDFPRDFSLDLSQKFIVVANQNSNNLTLFERNEGTGLLTLRKKDVYLPEGVCVYFRNEVD